MPAHEVVPRHAVDPRAWDDVVSASDDGWLWHLHRFQDVLGTWPRRRDASFAIRDDHGTIDAIVPAHVVERAFGPVRVRRIDLFGGPCMAPSAGDDERTAVRAALMDLAARTRAISVSAAMPTLAASARRPENPLTCFGFIGSTAAVWVSDLRGGPDGTWSRIQSRTRRYIRAAEAADVVVRAATIDDLDVYDEMHRATCARTGALPNPRSYFEAIWTILVPTGVALGFVAEHDGRIVAACNVARFKGDACYWTAASFDDARQLHANDVVLWHAMAACSRLGDAAMELGDTHAGDGSTKHRAISDFKRKFASATSPGHRGSISTAGPLRARVVRHLRGSR